MPVRAYIGLGSNLGDPAAQIDAAFAALAALPKSTLAARSGLYRSPSWGPIAQPDYLNAVAALDTDLAPEPLMSALLDIERQAGRERRERWGPRLIDLDLLLYGDLMLESAALTVPHPRLHERPFVLLPLVELAPSLAIPGVGLLHSLCDSVDRSTVQALG
jgi:2-amino-4-hydroxy-6-hydroxymethyldihydropteridine diphosphokinase